MVENNQKTDLDFIKKLFVRLAFDDVYTLEQIENLNKTDVIASDFFRDFDYSKIKSLDYILLTEEDIFEKKENPEFEYNYRIYLFYSNLLPDEREEIYNDFIKKYQYYDFDGSFNFNAEQHEIPEALLKYFVRNSMMFFEEFDRSTGMIDVEYFLMTVNHYYNNFSINVNEIACLEYDEIYS